MVVELFYVRLLAKEEGMGQEKCIRDQETKGPHAVMQS